MKIVSWSTAVVLATLAVAGVAGLSVRGFAGAGAGEGQQEPSAAVPSQTLLLGVERVTCGSCEARIRAALEGIPGVRAVAVDLGSRTVAVEYVQGAPDPRALAQVVTAAGYPARFLGFGAMPASAATGAGSGAGKGCGGGCCPG